MAISSAKDEHQFECLKCNFKWPNFAGPQDCPMCQHSYVKWLTYKEAKDDGATK